MNKKKEIDLRSVIKLHGHNTQEDELVRVNCEWQRKINKVNFKRIIEDKNNFLRNKLSKPQYKKKILESNLLRKILKRNYLLKKLNLPRKKLEELR